MKIILSVILLFFSANSFSGDADGKGIDCILSSESTSYASKKMYWFNNSRVISIGVAMNRKNSGGLSIYRKPESKNLTDDTNSVFYRASTTKIGWKTNQHNFVLNRKTLELQMINRDKEIPIYKGTCKVFKTFQKVIQRQTKKYYVKYFLMNNPFISALDL